jgi:hypothetical protein
VKSYPFIGIYLLVFLIVTGCAAQGEKIDVKISTKAGTEAKPPTDTAVKVAVVPFQDDRIDRSRLGTRQHLWGGESTFALPSSTVGEASARALADYLKQKGWQAALSTNGTGADITITGRVLEVAVDAKSGVAHTTITGRNKMVIQADNSADGSKIRETVSGIGNDTVFWFDPEDAEELLNDLYEKNFERFLADTKLDGKVLKLR